MIRQGMKVTIKDLIDLAKELCEEENVDGLGIDIDRVFQVNIINKTPVCSDTWELELTDFNRTTHKESGK